MTKTAFVLLTAAGVLALACVASPRPVEAWRGHHVHGYYSHCPQPGYGKYYNCGRYAVPGYPATEIYRSNVGYSDFGYCLLSGNALPSMPDVHMSAIVRDASDCSTLLHPSYSDAVTSLS